MNRESSVLTVRVTPRGSVRRTVVRRSLMASVTLTVFSPDARRTSSWIAGALSAVL
jgi:hypothetical protein